MTLEIPADWQPFLDEQIRSGGYGSQEQVVIDALRLLRSEREETLAGIRRGLADAAAGRVQPLAEAFDELRTELGHIDPS